MFITSVTQLCPFLGADEKDKYGAQTNGSECGTREGILSCSTILGTTWSILVSSVQEKGCLEGLADSGQDAGEHSLKDSLLPDASSTEEKPAVTEAEFPSMSRGSRDPRMLISLMVTDHEGRKLNNFQCAGPKISARTKWTPCGCCQRAGISPVRGHCC